jgi:hypothetical protein
MQNTTRANKQLSRMRPRKNDKFKSLPLQRTIKTIKRYESGTYKCLTSLQVSLTFYCKYRRKNRSKALSLSIAGMASRKSADV